MRVPIACTLDEAAGRTQLGEWRVAVGRSVVAAERLAPDHVSFRLREDLGGLDALVRLAQRETACCPFFDFAVRIDAAGASLHVCVPPDAAGVLDDFVGSTAAADG